MTKYAISFKLVEKDIFEEYIIASFDSELEVNKKPAYSGQKEIIFDHIYFLYYNEEGFTINKKADEDIGTWGIYPKDIYNTFSEAAHAFMIHLMEFKSTG